MRCTWERYGKRVRCPMCGRSQKRATTRQCRAIVPQILHDPRPCPYLAALLAAARLGADPAAYVSRLNRCRSAGCGLLHRKDGKAVCVGRGSSCQWIRNWAEFLAGEEDCPHWPSQCSQNQRDQDQPAE